METPWLPRCTQRECRVGTSEDVPSEVQTRRVLQFWFAVDDVFVSVCVSRYFWLHSLLIVFSVFSLYFVWCLMFSFLKMHLPRAVCRFVLWEAEWASAMLTVGVCRAAAIESFEGFMPETVTLKLVKRRKQKTHTSFYIILYRFIWTSLRVEIDDETRRTRREQLFTFDTSQVLSRTWERTLRNREPLPLLVLYTSPSTCKKTRRRHSTRANLFNFSIFEEPVPRDSRLSDLRWS